MRYRTHLGSKFTEGTRQIWLQLEKRDMTIEDFTKRVQWSRGKLHRYMFGDRAPELDAVLTFQRELGIDPTDFNRPPKRAFEVPSKAA